MFIYKPENMTFLKQILSSAEVTSIGIRNERNKKMVQKIPKNLSNNQVNVYSLWCVLNI